MANLEDKFDKIDSKLDKIGDRLGSIDSTLAAQHESLKEHMRRTSLLEEDVKPIKNHVAMIQGALKLIGLLCVVAAAVESVVYVLNFLSHML